MNLKAVLTIFFLLNSSASSFEVNTHQALTKKAIGEFSKIDSQHCIHRSETALMIFTKRHGGMGWNLKNEIASVRCVSKG